MNRARIEAAIERPTDEAIAALLDDTATVFWVDWREDEADIVRYCEDVLGTGRLSAEANGTNGAYALAVVFGDRRVPVPLTGTATDRHVALLALNDALAPDYEVRLCVDSADGDALAFLPLAATEWAALEARYAGALAKRFYRLAPRPNLFTDPLRFA